MIIDRLLNEKPLPFLNSMDLQTGKILVIGSSNTDMVVKTSCFPKPGETILGGDFIMNPGGKGANQAVAAARLGANIKFITKIGTDVFGAYTLEALKKESIDTGSIIEASNYPSGVALITVNDKGENTIVVASGANMQLDPNEISDELLQEADIILLQLEIPLPTINDIADRAKRYNKKLVLNPAPATDLPDELLDGLFLITPNERETEMLTGIYPSDEESMEQAGNYLLEKGVQNIAITLGSKGVFLMNAAGKYLIPAPSVRALDTTAAGDVFNGALVTAVAEGMCLPEACSFACRAAAIAVTRMGAQASAPFRNEL